MIKIAISGGIAFGPSWDDLQSLVRGMLNTPGVFTRISRRDGQANYRANHGVYDITFIPSSGDATEIEVTVNREQ